MSTVTGIKTKRVTTYGRNKVGISRVHEDLLSSPESVKRAPTSIDLPPVGNSRPPLTTKPSQDNVIVNDESGPKPKLGGKLKETDDKQGIEGGNRDGKHGIQKPKRTENAGRPALVESTKRAQPEKPGVPVKSTARTAAVEAPRRTQASKVAAPVRSSAISQQRVVAGPSKVSKAAIAVSDSTDEKSAEESDDSREDSSEASDSSRSTPKVARNRAKGMGRNRLRVPDTPSSYAPSPGPVRSARMDSVEIVSRPRRATRPHQYLPGTYRELSVELSDSFGRFTLNDDIPKGIAADESTDTTSSDGFKRLRGVCCSQITQTFSSVLGIVGSLYFPSSPPASKLTVAKVGEATYSEVFSIQDSRGSTVIMKIIPVDVTSSWNGTQDQARPAVTAAEEVAKEIESTKRMSDLPGGGFVTYKGGYIVQGAYNPQLLAQWDAFKAAYPGRSENIRPSKFNDAQKYVILFLSNGGIDLESFTFDARIGWIQAASIFWQVADALAKAEKWAGFEHRDLHEGQILIETVPTSTSTKSTRSAFHADSAASGVRATLIDFGLSRLQAQDGEIISTPIPEDILNGQGAQWDVYRAMTKILDGNPADSHPITNVMWLRYILTYLFDHKGLSKPLTITAVANKSAPRASTRSGPGPKKSGLLDGPTGAELQQLLKAYRSLNEVKKLLGSGKTSRKKDGADIGAAIGSASALMNWKER